MSAIRLFSPDQGPLPTPPARIRTVFDALAFYRALLKSRLEAGEYKAKTIANYERYLRRLEKDLGPMEVADLRQFHFTTWLNANADRWGVRSRQDAQNTILTCFRRLEDEEVLDRSPFRRPRFKYVAPIKPPFNREHYVALMRAARDRRQPKYRRGSRALRRAIYFLWKTGARPGEMRNLKWSQIDWVNGTVHLREHKTAHITGDDRIIGLPSRLLGLLAAMKRRASSTYVFLDNYGQPWSGTSEEDNERGKNSFCRLYKRWARRAGLPEKVTAHSLRHGFCVRAIEQGVPGRAIADQQGWKSERMVSHYGRGSRSNDQHIQGVAEAVDRGRKKK